MKEAFFIIDFDSTFVSVETLDELAVIILKNHPSRERITEEIASITQMGMDGTIDFETSLAKRLSLLTITKKDIDALIKHIKKKITPSVLRNKEFFKLHKDSIYIISGGFREYILPITKMFGIPDTHVFANSFIFDKKGKVTGYDTHNPLSGNNGKAKMLKSLHLNGTIHIIGDGYTDYEAKVQGGGDNFFAFVENIKRDSILQKANIVVSNFDELLFSLNLPRAYSYPKSKMKVLLLENINQLAVEQFKQQGYEVEALKEALGEEDLIKKIRDVSILGIRSKTEVTQKVIQKAHKLLVIGAYCIGTNQIDLASCAQKGICVFNAPYSNTRSVVELTIGEIIMLSRNVHDKSAKLHSGAWDKSATNSHEIRGKTLGIIGYGNIGSQLSVLAEMMGMKVLFYDVADKLALGNAIKCDTLKELLKQSDVVTVHIDGRKSNANVIGDREFALMKSGALFLNISRGFVVDVDALTNHIKSGHIRGAAIDVFPHEPKSNKEPFISPLQNLPNVILTPHIGGSTEEAQKNIGEFVTSKITDFVDNGSTTLSVNFPTIQLPLLNNAHRFIHIHKNIPGMLAHINSIIAQHALNIEGQYLKTDDQVGYVITDVNKGYNEKAIDELKKIPNTIKFRVLY